MKRVLFKNVCLGIALSVGLSCFATAEAAPPQAIPTGDGLSGAAPNPKAVMMYNLGITAYKQGSTDAAVIFFKRACDIDPNLADAQYNLAVIFQSQKRYKEAAPRFEEVLRIKPGDPDAHYQMGVILMDHLGRPQDARQHLSAIAPNSPHFPDSQRRIAAINSGAVPQQPVAQQPVQQPVQPAMQPPAQPYGSVPTNYNQASQQAYQATQQPQSYTPAVAPYQQPPAAPDYQQPPAQPAATVAPPQYQQPSYQQPIAAQPPAQPPVQQQTTAPVAAPLTSPNPVPVMANATLRIVATGFSAPAGLTFDRSGYLYVANYLTNSIDRIAPDGTRTQFSSGTNLRGPIGLVADDIGNVYVANYNGGTVAKINPAGVSTVVASGFKKPYYLTLDRDGNLYVSQQEDNSIVRITLPRPTAAVKP